jgi:voltage-gated potassium channel Kch
MDTVDQDRHSLFLLLSLVVFLVLSGFVREYRNVEKAVLELSMYVILVAGTLELSEKKSWRLPGILLASCSLVVALARFFHPLYILKVADWLVLAAFVGFVSFALFSYLGRPGSITSGRLYASVSLYFLLGVFYYAIFNLLETVQPRSFIEQGSTALNGISRHSLLYLSLVTLTTLGYGDIVPVSPPARTLAAFEAATGVLYIAFTVARLVAAYQRTDEA